MKFFAAPIQGFTDYIWRNSHRQIFGGIDMYYSPFLRIENNDLRKKDLKDISLENNDTSIFSPQILACEPQKMLLLISKIKEIGYSNIDINLGCPFPPIAKRHQGCGMLSNRDKIEEMVQVLTDIEGINISMKIRLGYQNRFEWKEVIPLLLRLAPTHITVHPRIGTQQYKGDLDLEAFREIYESLSTPIIYNGDILSKDDIERISEEFPKLEGIMIGRGLLTNPGLLSSGNLGIEPYVRFHDILLKAYTERLDGGEAQLLLKMKSIWEYFMSDADRKLLKAIKKSSSMEKYHTATYNLWKSF